MINIYEFIDKETFRPIESVFVRENALFEKARALKVLNKKIKKCKKCPGMNVCGVTEAACAWGNLEAEFMFVGQSLGTTCVPTLIPFTLGSGYYLDLAFRCVGKFRTDFFWSNVVHCHPVNNRASTREEKINCRSFLEQEIAIVKPKKIIALGIDAVKACQDVRSYGKTTADIIHFKHPASFLYSGASGVVKWINDLGRILNNEPRKIL
jgi:uracil-DNA glycosylase family 4